MPLLGKVMAGRARENGSRRSLVKPNDRQTARAKAVSNPRNGRILFLFGSAVTLLVVAWIVSASANPAPESFAPLVERLLPSVVNISTTQEVKSPFGEDEDGRPRIPPGVPDFFRDFFENPNVPRKTRSMGSGFIVDPDGVIITNNHVIDGADEVVVILDDGTELDATVEGVDKRTDIAVLRVKHDEPLPAVKFADSDKTRVGDWVVAIGNPFGLGGSVTAGIVSARGRDIRSGPYDDFIQTDAAINRGNSGGPLFTLDGEVVGINTSIISPQGGNVGIGFAIPSNMARNIVADLSEYGSVKRGWLGVGIQPVDDEIAESVGLEEPRGALVSNVMEGDPADKGGIRSGDIILEFDGKEIEDDRALIRAVADTPAGKKIKLVVWRNGKEKSMSLAIGQMRADEVASVGEDGEKKPVGTGDPVEALGMTLSPLSATAGNGRYQVPEGATGVLVTAVDRTSTAAQKGIRPGDIIVQVGGKEIVGPDDVTKAVEAAVGKDKRTVLVRVRRGDAFIFVPLPLKEEE